MADFHRLHSQDFKIPVAIERRFYIDIDGIALTGFIDRVDKTKSGGLSIVDYKTNKELFTKDDLEHNLQLTLYQLAVEQMWLFPVENLGLYHLRSNTMCSCGPRSGEQLEAARKLVVNIAENIQKENFPAHENRFCPCDFAEHCPYYRHSYIGEEATEDADAPAVDIEAAVGEYVTVQASIKELKEQLDELREEIVSYCQQEDINRVFGKTHAITYSLLERYGFEEEGVKALLEPEGLWQKVLSMDSSRLNEMVRDEALPMGLRQKLAEVRKLVSKTSYLRVRKLPTEQEE